MEKEGKITQLKENTFFGEFNDGTTFDMPLSMLDGHGVGTTVVYNIRDIDDEESEEDASFMLIGDEYATIILCEDTVNGFAILEAFRIYKDSFLNGEYDEIEQKQTLH